MKEATGELSMTVVTIIAVVAIAGLVAFLKPIIQNYIEGTFNDLTDGTGTGANNYSIK